MKKKIVIFGAAEQAEVAEFLFRHDSDLEPVAFTVDKEFIREETLSGLPIIPFEEVHERFSPDEHFGFVALGYTQMNQLRAQKLLAMKDKGYEITSYVSSKAVTWPGFQCGENCLILEGNNIQPFVKIGSNVTLWSYNHIGHHSIVGDNVFITSHVVVSGGVEIGNNSFIGVNATFRDHIQLGEFSLVAAGTLINKSTDAYGVYMGVPGKKNDKKSTDLKI